MFASRMTASCDWDTLLVTRDSYLAREHTCEKDWNRRLIFSLLIPMPVSLTEKCTSTSCPVALCTASFTAACAVEVAAWMRLSGASTKGIHA